MEARRYLCRHKQKLQDRRLGLSQRREQDRSTLVRVRVRIGQLDYASRLAGLTEPVTQQGIVSLGGERIISCDRRLIGKVEKRDCRSVKRLVIRDCKGRNRLAESRQRQSIAKLFQLAPAFRIRQVARLATAGNRTIQSHAKSFVRSASDENSRVELAVLVTILPRGDRVEDGVTIAHAHGIDSDGIPDDIPQTTNRSEVIADLVPIVSTGNVVGSAHAC